MRQNHSSHSSKLTQGVREAISCSEPHYKLLSFSMIIVKPVPQPRSPLQLLAHFPAPLLFLSPPMCNPLCWRDATTHTGWISGPLFSSACSHIIFFLKQQLRWPGKVPPHTSGIFDLSVQTTSWGSAAKGAAVIWHKSKAFRSHF